VRAATALRAVLNGFIRKRPFPLLGGSPNGFAANEDELLHFGGEMYVKYSSGHVHYQDEFGRTEKPREFLEKDLPASSQGYVRLWVGAIL
jgi:hypothetical protein